MRTDNEWYKNRILWSAKKSYLFDYSCIEFDDLKSSHKDCIQKLIDKTDIPVIVFFESCNKWTLLCANKLYSYYDDVLHCVDKDNFNQKITPHIDINSEPISHNLEKKDAKWLKMNETGEYIWLPSSNVLWTFWGLLKMLAKLK